MKVKGQALFSVKVRVKGYKVTTIVCIYSLAVHIGIVNNFTKCLF